MTLFTLRLGIQPQRERFGDEGELTIGREKRALMKAGQYGNRDIHHCTLKTAAGQTEPGQGDAVPKICRLAQDRNTRQSIFQHSVFDFVTSARQQFGTNNLGDTDKIFSDELGQVRRVRGMNAAEEIDPDAGIDKNLSYWPATRHVDVICSGPAVEGVSRVKPAAPLPFAASARIGARG
jgi:hypothetical protein